MLSSSNPETDPVLSNYMDFIFKWRVVLAAIFICGASGFVYEAAIGVPATKDRTVQEDRARADRWKQDIINGRDIRYYQQYLEDHPQEKNTPGAQKRLQMLELEREMYLKTLK